MSKNKKYLFEAIAGLLIYITVVLMFSDNPAPIKEPEKVISKKTTISVPTTTNEYDESKSTLKFLSTPAPVMDSIH